MEACKAKSDLPTAGDDSVTVHGAEQDSGGAAVPPPS